MLLVEFLGREEITLRNETIMNEYIQNEPTVYIGCGKV